MNGTISLTAPNGTVVLGLEAAAQVLVRLKESMPLRQFPVALAGERRHAGGDGRRRDGETAKRRMGEVRAAKGWRVQAAQG
ncbi:MAG: hypothetical protein V9E83_05405 [Baekduia sp.]